MFFTTGRFANGSNGRTGDDPGTGTGRQQDDAGCTESTIDAVRNRAVDHRNSTHGPRRLFVGFFDARLNFVGFAVAPADFAIAVAADDHGRKAEPSATFDHGGTTFDFDGPFDQTRNPVSPGLCGILFGCL